MKSSSYWQKRFKDLEEMSNDIGEDAIEEIKRGFAKASLDIQRDINKWFERLAINNNVSLSEARKMLVRNDLKEFKWTVDEYIKYGKENAVSQKWLKELENASAKYHISRLESLQIQVQNHLEVAFGNEVDVLNRGLEKVFIKDYNHTLFEIQKGTGIGKTVPTINDKQLKEVIKKPWHKDGLNFSDRIWRNKNEMVKKLHQELTRNIANGKDISKTIKNLEKYVNTDIKNKNFVIRRLVQTEQAVFRSKAQLEGFMELGCKEYEIIATLDKLTSNVCQDMDKKHYDVEDFHIGTTAPPFHPNCRSCICPYFDDEFTEDVMRAARTEDGTLYRVPSDMNYKEWKEKFLKNGAKTDLTKLEKGDRIEERNKIGIDYDNSKRTGDLQYSRSDRKLDISTIDESLNSAKINTNMKDVESIMGIKVGDTDGYKTKVVSIREIDFNRDKNILLEEFAEKYRYADVEHAYVISPKNVMIELEGSSSLVNIELAAMEFLKDSITIHNHPRFYEDIEPDSFSSDDIEAFFMYFIKELYVVRGNKVNVIDYIGKYLTKETALLKYTEARFEVFENALVNNVEIELEQLETIKRLIEILEGLSFYEF